jgi:hypothetical protein
MAMPRVSERPTIRPSDAVDERNSEVHVKAATSKSDSIAPEMPHSETRIATHPKMGAAIDDEAWAHQTIGEPMIALSTDLLRRLPLDHRAGYLLSLMDGTMDLETVVDVSAMARADVLRIARALFEAGIITFR